MTKEAQTTEEITVIGERYLRHRPFLVVTSKQRPAKGTRTEKPKPALQRFERPVVVDRISDVHLREAEVIIDILNRTCVKSRFNEVATYEQVVESYLSKYAEIVSQGLQVYATQKLGMKVPEVVKGLPNVVAE